MPTSREIYEKINKKVEKWTEVLYFGLFKVTVPAALLPNCLWSFYIYFSTDLGRDAFNVPFPIW